MLDIFTLGRLLKSSQTRDIPGNPSLARDLGKSTFEDALIGGVGKSILKVSPNPGYPREPQLSWGFHSVGKNILKIPHTYWEGIKRDQPHMRGDFKSLPKPGKIPGTSV